MTVVFLLHACWSPPSWCRATMTPWPRLACSLSLRPCIVDDPLTPAAKLAHRQMPRVPLDEQTQEKPRFGRCPVSLQGSRHTQNPFTTALRVRPRWRIHQTDLLGRLWRVRTICHAIRCGHSQTSAVPSPLPQQNLRSCNRQPAHCPPLRSSVRCHLQTFAGQVAVNRRTVRSLRGSIRHHLSSRFAGLARVIWCAAKRLGGSAWRLCVIKRWSITRSCCVLPPS